MDSGPATFYSEALENAVDSESEDEIAWDNFSDLENDNIYSEAAPTFYGFYEDDIDVDGNFPINMAIDSYVYIEMIGVELEYTTTDEDGNEETNDVSCALTGTPIDNERVTVIGYTGPWTDSDDEQVCGVLIYLE